MVQQPGLRALLHRQPGSRPHYSTAPCPKPRHATALQQSRSVSAQSVAADEVSEVAEEQGGSVSDRERAQYERWAAEVAVRTFLLFTVFRMSGNNTPVC